MGVYEIGGITMNLSFIIVIIVALMGALVFKKLRFPAGLMVGAMLASGILNIFTGIVNVPLGVKFFIQIIAGAFVGMAMDKEKLKELKAIIKPAIFMILGLLFINIFLGVLIYFITDLDLITALFATVPGGMTDVSIISQDMGADTARTAIFQLARLVGVVTFFPLIIKALNKRINKDKLSILQENKEVFNEMVVTKVEEDEALDEGFKGENLNKAKEVFLTLVVAFLGGVLGEVLNVPAGAMLFALIGVIVMKVFFNKGYIPKLLKDTAQIMAGAFIGGSITKEVILSLRFAIPSIIILIILYAVLCMSLGYLISKWFKIDLITALFACTPAGASDMALIASDIGAEGSYVALFQITRLISVIAFFHGTIKIITDIFV